MRLPKKEEFYNPSIKKILVTIGGMPHQVFAAGLQAGQIYPELIKYFSKKISDMTWEDFLTTKFAKLIDTRLSIDNTLYGSGKTVGKSCILLQIEKGSEASGDLTCYVFTKSIISTKSFVSITTRNMLMIFFCVCTFITFNIF